ncbi:HAD-like domain-containing protein [Dunaliella salina]|uniref:HAD-like domain-containing protein n=1 Tax=Dunaliella salina TaxID=3046 RepID=A0ABQ7GWR4_DUNSA|nr:HAD-like domain-containing protein [Dunaliella salina]|eukprot:KAF5839035.1 HAD-like domain-containing protein [Dunaliella salina]
MEGSSLAKKILFSDIDGTCMHDPGVEAGRSLPAGNMLLTTPPSTSGRVGVISSATIDMVAAFRKQGLKFVVVTGARLSTLLMRLPYLPYADALVCENGGRIFYPGGSLETACPLTEDLEWRAAQGAAGPTQQDATAPEARQGILWEYYRKLKSEGWQIDANGYTTSFRMMVKGKSEEQLQGAISSAPKELQSTFNLGHADFYPASSGKVGAARHLVQRFGTSFDLATFMCDDDNDLDLAAVVAKAFLLPHTSESVKRAVAARPDHFVLASKQGTEATEEMLVKVGQYYQGGLT